MNLLDLPAEMLYEIVRHLGHGDQVSLASTCKQLRPLRPRVQTVAGEDFTVRQNTRPYRFPEAYVDVPSLAWGLTAVRMSFNCEAGQRRDGHGAEYPVQRLWLRLMRKGEVIQETTVTAFIPVCSGLSTITIEEVANHPVVTKARKGDTLTVMRHTSIDGERRPATWEVKDFRVTLFFKR